MAVPPHKLEGAQAPSAHELSNVRSALEREVRDWDEMSKFLRGRCEKYFAINGKKIFGDVDVSFVAGIGRDYIIQVDFEIEKPQGDKESVVYYFIYFPDLPSPEVVGYEDLSSAAEAFCNLLEKKHRDSLNSIQKGFWARYFESFGVPGTLAVLSLIAAVISSWIGSAPNELWNLCIAAFAFYFGTKAVEKTGKG